MEYKNQFGDYLYNKLPRVYKYEDLKQKPREPLRRYFQVYGEGLDNFYDDLKKYEDILDLDKVGESLLPLMAEERMLKTTTLRGNKLRRMLKVLPYLYRKKGEREAFKYLGREIYNVKTEVDVRTSEEIGLPQGSERTLHLLIEADGSLDDLQAKQEMYMEMAEYIRPVNWSLALLLTYIYYEQYESYIKIKEDSSDFLSEYDKFTDVYRDRKVTITGDELLNKSFLTNVSRLLNMEEQDTIQEAYDDLALSLDNDSYLQEMIDEYVGDLFSIPVETDIYLAKMLDYVIDKMILPEEEDSLDRVASDYRDFSTLEEAIIENLKTQIQIAEEEIDLVEPIGYDRAPIKLKEETDDAFVTDNSENYTRKEKDFGEIIVHSVKGFVARTNKHKLNTEMLTNDWIPDNPIISA